VAFELVVLGGSLGGVRAMRTILSTLPEDFPIPLAAVLHRGEDHGRLAQALSSPGGLPVTDAHDKAPLVAGHVYLAPSGYHLLIDCSFAIRNPQSATGRSRLEMVPHLALSTEGPVSGGRPSIDVLFESAALVLGHRVIGVLLTGSNRDGANGLARIKACGGLTAVQDPATCEGSDTPVAALAVTGHLSIAIGDIGAFLVQAVRERDARTTT
jgi:two-component system chemotaxis response regulator CheB